MVAGSVITGLIVASGLAVVVFGGAAEPCHHRGRSSGVRSWLGNGLQARYGHPGGIRLGLPRHRRLRLAQQITHQASVPRAVAPATGSMLQLLT